MEITSQYYFLNEQSTSEQFFISITTEDGFSADGTYYSIFVVHQSDNHWTNSNEIIVGSFVDENIVCIDDCPGEIIDAEDWAIPFHCRSRSKYWYCCRGIDLVHPILILNYLQ